jgi:GNAT superfamily N-acetyltransferase
MNQPTAHPPGPTPELVRADARLTEKLFPLIAAYYAFDGIHFDEPALRRGLEVLFAEPALGGAWLVQIAGENVGYFVLTYSFDLEFGGRVATVTELYLREEARGQGVGRAVLAFVEDVLRGLSIGAYELQVERDNVRARGFYQRLGFEAHDRIPLSKRVGARIPTTRPSTAGRSA